MEPFSLTVVMGSRLETLADDLSVRLRRGRSVFGRETIVVPSKGTARWLCSWLARRDGICSNIDFSLPKDFIAGRLCGLSKEDSSACSSELARWRIYAALPELIAAKPEEFASPAAYIAEGGSDSPIRRWQLAGKLAACFDQYITLRPDMVLDWETRPDSPLPPAHCGSRSPQWVRHWRWQRSLWLAVMANLKTHPPREFARILENGSLRAEGLPPRVFVFGFSTMPPVYLDLFMALGRHSETVLHYLNPCQCYWAEIKSAKESLRELSKFDPDRWCELHIDEPNELLASFGKAGREFFARLISISGDLSPEEAFPQPEEAQNALQTLQNGVFEMAPARDIASPFRHNDISVGIHSCHSRMREVEVLRDEILDMLERESRDGKSSLRPSDIIVMAPDIASYVPFIKAVFGGDRRGGLRLDYSIADQSLGAETPEATAFLSLLRIPLGRFSSEEVLAPLDCQAVRERFNLSSDSIAWLRTRLREAGAAWGIDAEHRRIVMERDGSSSAPVFEENSWRFALERLLLGHAMESAEDLSGTLSVAGRHIAPLSLGEGEGPEAVGSLSCYFDKLAAFSKETGKALAPEAWRILLLGLVEDFFVTDGPSSDGVIDTVKALGSMLSEAVVSLPPDLEIPYEVMFSAASEVIAASSGGSGFLRGGITFCRMQPLRNIPARAVCLLGMNDGEFPRPDRERGFDLLREGRRLCDRSPRDDDRQLFLDALLSSRRYFRILYIGQSDKDNSPIPPSPAVDEFCEHFKAVFGSDALAKIRFRHPLHPFSPRYFSEAARSSWLAKARRSGGSDWSVPYFSFSLPDLDAAKALSSRESLPSPPWASLFKPLPPASSLFESSVAGLVWRLRNLSGAFLEERLGVSLDVPGDDSLPEDEPFSFDELQKYNLKSSLLKGVLRNPSLSDKDAYRFQRACGSVLGGPLGWMRFSETFDTVSSFAKGIGGKLGAKLPPLHVELAPPLPELKSLFPDMPSDLSIKLEFKSDRLFEGGLAFFRPSSLKAKDFLAAWIGHLALNFSGAGGSVRNTVLFGLANGKTVCETFPPMEREKAGRLLASLACLCSEGLCRPLPLFPETSLEYARAFRGMELEQALSSEPSDDAFASANCAWHGSFKVRGEKQEPAFHFAFGSDLTMFREIPELEALFHSSSLLCFLPLLNGLETSPRRGRK